MKMTQLTPPGYALECSYCSCTRRPLLSDARPLTARPLPRPGGATGSGRRLRMVSYVDVANPTINADPMANRC